MAAHTKITNRVSPAMERTGQWVFSQDIPADILIQVGEAKFPLHKFLLVAKSNYIRRLILESKDPDTTRLDLSNIPGGAEIFEKAIKFCYGVNFEITVHNVAALRCAAEYLEMTDEYCDGNLAGRTDDFLVQVALTSLSGAVVVLKSCEDLLPIAEEINIVQRCVELAAAKACNEANFPSRSPPNWWTEELSIVHITFFAKIIASMKSRGAKPLTIASAIITYTERALPDLVRDRSGNSVTASISIDTSARIHQRELLNAIVSLLPVETQRASFPINFLSCLLRAAIFLENEDVCKKQLEKRISAILEHVTVDDLLVLSYTFDGERLFDLESVRRIISGFVEKEKSVSVFNGGDFREPSLTTAMLRVAKTVDAYLGEIATIPELSISKFNGIANLVPKNARKVDDDLYRAIDIYLKAHPNLDEIEREKVCSVMDPLKLSYEARVHASQNKRLPVQIVLHALYFDQLQIRSDKNGRSTPTPDAISMRSQVQADVSLAKENEALRTELLQMKAYISDIQNKNQVGSTSARINPKKPTFFSSVSKKLGKLNPFKHGSKDTSHIEDGNDVDLTKPRRRRFSIS
ncbi:putative BTB/POZ domain, NPH3 domain, NPH3/RPT2-like family protein [Helianthus annuus]|nr:putative BTB/POZ domain, NPH3 domain, NPH3/RPT2-like family protein [Helianthus annuus]KAJ0719771.1 putative BTB/POZ domain, NPH3 domain, NPH3/RPT2-like family protein [Helianthus annuus]KAJ0898638.1 putative BTB/POZ domain, NPH3 domain, NPH3/RPT2-like family protein [Helianthus annuus]KAJ0902289.1 putative Root phototropism protein [Helianthus annuus]